MRTNDDTTEPESYLEAVGILVRTERVPAPIVEELLKPELMDWVNSLRTKPVRMSDWRQTLNTRLEEKVKREGISRPEAALYVGMTDASFDSLVKLGLPNLPVRGDRFLKGELDAFADGYLPSFKTWGTRTSLLLEFHHNLAAQTGFEAEPQWCEMEEHKFLADVQCVNPECRPGKPPRKVCVAHRERLGDRYEKSLCAECVRRVLHGDLRGRFRIAGTEQRLLKDYPR